MFMRAATALPSLLRRTETAADFYTEAGKYTR